MERSKGYPKLPALIALSVAITSGTLVYSGKQPLLLDPPATNTHLPQEKALQLQASNSLLIAESIPPKPVQEYLPQARSLRGTVPDGELTIGANGLPLITPAMRRLFEYFLATLGEQPVESIREQLYEHIESQYSLPAAQSAIGYFDHYVSYRLKLAEQELSLSAATKSLPIVERLHQRLSLLTELRSTELGAEMVEAFFANEEDYDRYTLAKYAITTNSSLSPEQQLQALDTLNETWPQFSQNPSIDSRQRDINLQVANARSNGATETEIYNIRSQAFGYEAADRLTTLDQQRDAWQQRLDHYSQQKQELLAFGVKENSTALNTLRENLFTGAKLKMVQALEKLQRL